MVITGGPGGVSTPLYTYSMNLGHKHQSLRRKVLQNKNLKSTPLIRSVDSLVYIVSILSLLFTLDQVRIVWIENNASGVSLLSWIFYTISSLVWLFYGILHKEKNCYHHQSPLGRLFTLCSGRNSFSLRSTDFNLFRF